MGFLDSILGRSKPVRPDLDQLFAVPSAAVTLTAAGGFEPTGVGAVCFRAAEGGAFARLEADVTSLLRTGGGARIERSVDAYGYTWLVVRGDPGDVSGLVTDLHAVNATLADGGHGAALLASLIAFAGPEARRLLLVYLYKRGTFYPFVPLDGQRRDSAAEMSARAWLGTELRVEPDVSRWFPLWGAPL